MVRPIMECMYNLVIYTKRIFKCLKQYQEEQPAAGLLIMISSIFPVLWLYDAGLRMAHIRREKMSYKIKVTMLIKILNDIVCIPADHYLVSISNTGRRHQRRLYKTKTISFLMSMHSWTHSFH